MKHITHSAALAVIAATLMLLLAVAGAQAVINGDAKAQGQQAIIFPQLTAADTLETVWVKGLHREITFQIKISGITAGDTLYAQLQGSLDDSTYVNLDDTGATQAFAADGTWSMTYDLLTSWKYVRIAYPMFSGTLTVNTKAFISSKE